MQSDDSIRAPIDRLVDAIDDRTALVAISLVLFRSGTLQEVAPVIERAHHVGAHVVLDVYQGAGTVPMDVTALGADFAVGGSVKWLCGGPGAGYLYVRPDLMAALKPAVVGWAGHASPFAFETGAIRYAGSADRFQSGTPNVPALARGASRLRDRRRDRRRGDSRPIAAPHAAADRRRPGARLEAEHAHRRSTSAAARW